MLNRVGEIHYGPLYRKSEGLNAKTSEGLVVSSSCT